MIVLTPSLDLSVASSDYIGATMASISIDLGHNVASVDSDKEIVATITDGVAPIHEEGLPERIADHAGERQWPSPSHDGV